MRELKGNWKDLFNGFMLALDPRKMFLGFCGIMFTLFIPLAVTCWAANHMDPSAVQRPHTFRIDEIWSTIHQAFTVIYCGTANFDTTWYVKLSHCIGIFISMLAIWGFFGGAISRIAAYEIAKDGERIETARALHFARKKFWAFFMSPWICIIGFVFFLFCNFMGGVVGRLLDFAVIGGPIVALMLPLALLSGFIMVLIGLGTIGGLPLFAPAVAAEGTDPFDAVSRGFSYVYSRPWHFLFYNVVAKLYGVVCISFVILFAVTLCHVGLKAGAMGFDSFGVRENPKSPNARPPDRPKNAKPGSPEEKEWQRKVSDFHMKTRAEAYDEKYDAVYDRFSDITDAAWSMILTDKYDNVHCRIRRPNDVYHQLMRASNCIVKPDLSLSIPKLKTPGHQVAAWIVLSWLVGALGLALGYIPAYCFSQETLIYFLLRKKVDGIEMNEVFEELDEEALAPEPAAAPKGEGEKPAPPAEEKKS